jgi:hypothetical protein
MYAFVFAKEDIYFRLVYRLDYVGYVLAFQPLDGIGLILLFHGVKHHVPHAFLQLIDVVEEYFQVGSVLFWTVGRHCGQEWIIL